MTATETTTLTADGRDPRTEAWLDAKHVTWTFEPALDLDRIDVAKSLANQARVDEPLIEEVVDRYTAGYKRGDIFPPLLVHKTSRQAKKLVLLGGNHRNASASRAKVRTHSAYIVECEPETALALTYEDNSRHGYPPSRSERLAQAVHLIDSGWTQRAAADAVGLAETEVSVARTATAASRRAKEHGVRGFDKLPSGSKVHLGRVQSDPVFTEAARLVVDGRLTTNETGELCKRLKSAGSDQKALAVIGTEIEERRDEIQRSVGRGARKAGSSDYGKAKTAVVALLDVKPEKVALSCPTADAQKRLRDQCKDAARRLMEINKALGGRG